MKSQRLWFLLILIYGLLPAGGLNLRQAAFGQTMAEPPVDSGWPRTHQKDGQTVVIFQPQVDDWPDHKQIEFRAATAVTPRGAAEPVYGVISARADTLVDPDSRIVYLTNMQADVRFPGQDEAKTQMLQSLVQQVAGSQSFIAISLDRVLACMKPPNVKATGIQINLDPPPMYYSASPAILVILQGPPLFKPIQGTHLNFTVNTNWDLLQDQATSKYFLLNGDSWFSTGDLMNGPWTPAESLPTDLMRLPSGANWDDVRKHVPGTTATSVPKVIVSTQPAELIVTNGPPEMVSIPGTTLTHVINPEMSLFFDTADNYNYYLVAGRWFRTRNLNGGWEAASARLPEEFQKIPPDSSEGYVLASVPGTDQANDAILLAAVPHKATINIQNTTTTVVYDGAPKFMPIVGTSMTYAVNTANQVICANGMYYCCYQGVWFVSPAPTGAWVVCSSVPQVIYTIPASSPLYNCTYVVAYSSTPTTVVYGYTSGYSGEYVAATGALMFGAGMIAGAVIANNSDHYYPYPAPYASYGCAAQYNYSSGYYSKTATAYGPYGGASSTASYNAATGTYSRSASAYGPNGSASAQHAYNPYTNTSASHASASNGYESWGASAVSHNGNYAAAGHQTNANGSSSGWAETSSGKGGNAYQTAGGATVAKGNDGDVYAGKDGNVYKKSDDGGWQQHTSGGWQSASQNSSFQSHESELNSEASSRSFGNSQASRSAGFGGGAARRR